MKGTHLIQIFIKYFCTINMIKETFCFINKQQ